MRYQDRNHSATPNPQNGAVVAQWIKPRTLNDEVPSSNLLAAAVVPLGKALYPHCLVPLGSWIGSPPKRLPAEF